jgi:hypothetical protein
MNPLLDTREYEVEFPDGSIDVLTAQFVERVSTRSRVTKRNFYSKTVPTPTAANATQRS